MWSYMKCSFYIFKHCGIVWLGMCCQEDSPGPHLDVFVDDEPIILAVKVCLVVNIFKFTKIEIAYVDLLLRGVLHMSCVIPGRTPNGAFFSAGGAAMESTHQCSTHFFQQFLVQSTCKIVCLGGQVAKAEIMDTEEWYSMCMCVRI